MPIYYKGKQIERGDIRYGASNSANIYIVSFDLFITFPEDSGVFYKAPLDIKLHELVTNIKDSYLIDYGDGSPVFIDVANRYKTVYHEYVSSTKTKTFTLKIISAYIEPVLEERILDGILEENNKDLPYKIYIKRGV